MNSKNKAFTLIELLVVIAIVSILMSVLVPAVSQAKLFAYKTVCTSNLHHIDLGFALYRQDNDGFYPSQQDGSGFWLWMGRGFREPLHPYLNSENGKVTILTCPIDAKKQDYEYTSYAYSMCFYHSPEQINSLTSKSQTYGSAAMPSVHNRTSDVRSPSKKVLCGEWLNNHDVEILQWGWWETAGSRNFLFADGSIDFLSADKINPARGDNLPDPNRTVNGIEGQDRK